MEHRNAKRNAAIYARRCSGLTLKEIGREFQLTKETVREIARRMERQAMYAALSEFARKMTTPKAEEEDLVTGYRSAAEECQQQAARSATGLQRDYWLKIADEWITLAEEAERSRLEY
jgi:predicted transcriptional regulator